MTSVREACESVESSAFSARVNVASNLKTFLRAIGSEEAFRMLATATRRDPGLRRGLLGRITALASAEVDPDRENPSDTPLAVYLTLLNETDFEFALVAARIVSACAHCWWSKAVARQILLSNPFASRRAEVSTTLTPFAGSVHYGTANLATDLVVSWPAHARTSLPQASPDKAGWIASKSENPPGGLFASTQTVTVEV